LRGQGERASATGRAGRAPWRSIAACGVGAVAILASAASAAPARSGEPQLPGIAEAAAACAALPLRTRGTVHHFCDCQAGAEPGCVPGRDENAGVSPAAPKRTFEAAAAAFRTLRAGDTVAFCRGGAFAARTDLRWGNTACRPGASPLDPANAGTCDIRDYRAPWGGSARPVLAAAGTGNLFEFSARGHHQGVRLLNLELRGGGGGPGAPAGARWGVWLYGRKTGFLVCNDVFDGWSIAINFQSNEDGRTSGNTVLGSRITNSGNQGFLGRGDGLALRSNYWANNGSANDRDHTIYVSGDADPDGTEYTQAGGAIVGNEIHAGVAPRSRENSAGCRDDSRPCCQGTLIVVHGRWDGFVIEDNWLDGGANDGRGCWGISVEHAGFPKATLFRRFALRRNFVTRTGNSSLDVNQSTDAVIENNVVVPSQPQRPAIAAPLYPHRPSHGDDVNTRAVVRNNTVYFSPEASSGSVGIQVGVEGSGYVVANNAVHFGGRGGTCFALPLPVASYAYVDHNLCSGADRWEVAHATLADWHSHAGGAFDRGSLAAPAAFRDAPRDLAPAAGSPLVGAGDAAQAPAADQRRRARSARPSIGALEP
jgi:hypothetical protein